MRVPIRLAIDRADNIFIVDPKSKLLLIRRPDGRILREIRGLSHPVSVAADSMGNIFVGDSASGSVDVYDSFGGLLRSLGAGAGEFQFPSDIAIDPVTEDVYVSDSRAHVVRQYGPSGVLVRTIGGFGSGDGELNTPTGVFWDVVRLELFVVDQRNSRIQVFDSSGNFQFCIASRSPADCPGGLSLTPCDEIRQFDQGIWVDSQGRIFVADAFEGRIHVIDRDGTVLSSIGSLGTGPGQMRVPSDLVVDSYGRLFVASANNARVEVFGLDSFSDPEAFAPGRLEVVPDRLDTTITSEIVAYLEIPGYSLTGVTGIVANGVATPLSVSVGDFDADTVPDLRMVFGADLIRSLPSQGEATISVTGAIASLHFGESTRIAVIAVDSDGDGVPDATDICPETPVSEPVDMDGCSTGQLAAIPTLSWWAAALLTACLILASIRVIRGRTNGETVR